MAKKKKSRPKQRGICSKLRNGRTYYYGVLPKRPGASGGRYRTVGLGYDFAEAQRLWHQYNGEEAEAEEIRQERAETLKGEMLTVRGLIGRFIEYVTDTARKPNTVTFYRQKLVGDWKTDKPHEFKPLDDWLIDNDMADLPADGLKPSHVERWLKACGGGVSHRHNLIKAVKRAYSWALKEERIISVNPLDGLKKPAQTTRETDIRPEQWKRVIETIEGDSVIYDIAVVLGETGARPQEIRTAEVRHFDRNGRRLHFPADEAKGERSSRTIFLNDRAFDVVSRLALKAGDGIIFRNHYGKPWSQQALTKRFQKVSIKAGVKITPYNVRHAWCTNSLEAGVDPVTTGILMGHADIKMVWQKYNKLRHREAHLRESLDKATGAIREAV